MIFFFYLHQISAQQTKRIDLTVNFTDLEGSQSFKNSSYKKYHSDSLAVLKESIKMRNRFVSEGYLNCNIDSLNISDSTAEVFLYCGRKYLEATLKLKFTKEERLIARLKDKDSVNLVEFIEIKDKILAYYEDNGYPFTQVKIDSIHIDNECFAGVVFVNKGDLVRISSISIFGDAKTNDAIIYNSIDIFPNDLYSEEKIKAIGNKIETLPYLSLYMEPDIIYNSDLSVSIKIYVNTEKANKFDGFIGFANSEETGKIEFTGKVALSLTNTIGQGEFIALEWQKIKELSQKLYIAVEYPYLFKTPAGFLGNFLIKRQDSSYVTIDYSLGGQYLINSQNKFSITYRRKSSQLGIVDGASLKALPSNIDFEINLVEFGISTNKLDNSINPRKGFYSYLKLSGGKKEVFKNSQIQDSLYNDLVLHTEYGEVNSRIEVFMPLFKNQVLSVQNKTSYLYSSTLFQNELMEFGGTSTLRGFDEDAFDASFYSILTLEYRVLIGKISNVYAFFDQAYYQSNTNYSYVEDNPFGFGLGIQLGSKSGVFTLSYALGKQFDNPLSFSSAKVHIGYINKF